MFISRQKGFIQPASFISSLYLTKLACRLIIVNLKITAIFGILLFVKMEFIAVM